MENNLILTLHSIYKGQTLFKLGLSYGKLNFLAPASGMGKSALGLFLKDESFRRLGLEKSGPSFVPKLDWEILIDGPLGLVELIAPESRKGRLIDYLNFKAPLEGLFKRKGKSSCTRCQVEPLKVESGNFLSQLQSLKEAHLLLGLKVKISAQEILALLEWARRQSITKILIGESVIGLPQIPTEDPSFSKSLFLESVKQIEITLLSEIRSRTSLDESLSQSVGELLSQSKVLAATLKIEATPVLMTGDIVSGVERGFKIKTEFNLSLPYICLNCGAGYQTLPEPRIDGLEISKIQQVKLKDLKKLFEDNFQNDWLRIFELDLGDAFLSQAVDEISPDLLTELKMLSLSLQQIRDSIVFVDSTLSNKGKVIAVELTALDNAVIAHSKDGLSLDNFLPPDARRPSEILSKQVEVKFKSKRNSVEPLLVETGVEKPIVELYASLPEARIRNLTAKDLSYHSAKCMDCGGAESSVVSIGSLGKKAEVCNTCFGSRYQERATFVSYQNVSISKLLKLTVFEASELFSKRAEISGLLNHLINQGFGEYRLGDEFRTLPSRARAALEG